MQDQFSQTELDAFLDEALAPERMARIEAVLRDDAQLAELLKAAIARRDLGVHTLGGMWRRHRLTCPTREQLGSFLLGVLDRSMEAYLRFHVDTAGCRLCHASLADLRAQQTATDEVEASSRRRRYFQSSAGMLSSQ